MNDNFSTPGNTNLKAAVSSLKQIIHIWHGRRMMELGAGIILSLFSLLLGLAVLSLAGSKVAASVVGLGLVGAWLLRGVGVGRILSRYAERLYTHNVMFKALTDVRVWFFRRVAHNSATGLGLLQAGDVLARLVTDISVLDGLYLRILVPFIGALFTCVIIFSTCLYYGGFALALLLGLCFVLAAFITPFMGSVWSFKTSSGLAAQLGRLRIVVLDMVSGLREVRAFGAEERMCAHISNCEDEIAHIQGQQSQHAAIAGAFSFFFMQCGVAFILLGILNIAHMHLGAMASIIVLFLFISSFELVSGLTRSGILAGQIMNSAQRVTSVAQAKRQPSGQAHAPSDKTIRFENVVFSYEGREKPILNGFNLTIQPGSHVAIIGASGSGKSTMASLLLGLYSPQQGHITLGGLPLEDIALESLRNQIAWLSQATHLFDDTIRANLLLGKPNASDEELWSALDRAAIGDMVRSLPDQLDSWVGEGGAKLSGGQGRRIALARTLLHDGPILILDEPTAGLDNDTARAFASLLNQVAANKTVIFITHYLTGVEKLDKIWRIEGGKALAVMA